MTAFYNEIDERAAAVLRQLIDENVIAPGVVDTRSIKDLTPEDLKGFTQVHFFAGGGLWSVAARQAGWPDDKPLWTGSCPCQPFSVAGRRAGTDDPRHLWPDFRRLIGAHRPPVVVGEQVAGAAGYGWFDGVHADLEDEGYASRAVDIPACAIDAPHQRQRLYWIAVANNEGVQCRPRLCEGTTQQDRIVLTDGNGFPIHVADAEGEHRRGDLAERRAERRASDRRLDAEPVDHTGCAGLEGQRRDVVGAAQGWCEPHRPVAPPNDRNGSWFADAEWVMCHDGKARRTKPSITMLVDGLPGRVGIWSIAGNAIVPVLAAEVLKAHLETELT